MSTRNPSPPADASGGIKQFDRIGDTSYSKRWLFSLLMDLLKLIDSQPSNSDTIEELNPDLEDRLCCLWDLTVNRDVLSHLDEFDLVTVLSDTLVCHRYPRLLEITVGILANMAYDSTACQKMSENDVFINRSLLLFYSRDTPTLTEVCRLVQTVLASCEYSTPWLTAIKFQSDFLDNLLFILRGSTNDNLLIATIRLLDAITRGDDSLAEVWCGSDLLNAILVAQHEMKWVHGNEVEIIHKLFYTFSSNVTGVGALMKSFDQLLPTFGVYLRKVCEDESHLIPFSTYYNSLRAIVPVMDSVVASLPAQRAVSCFDPDPTVLPSLIHITQGCLKQLSDFPLARGILADLRVLYQDLIATIQQTLQASTGSSDDSAPLDPSLSQSFHWLVTLDQDDQAAQREAFLSCCLNDASVDTSSHLLFICNCLRLPRLLELLTDAC